MKIKIKGLVEEEQEIDVEFPAYFMSIEEGVDEDDGSYSCTTVMRLEEDGSHRIATLYQNGSGAYGDIHYEVVSGFGGDHAANLLSEVYLGGELEPCNEHAFYDVFVAIQRTLDAVPKPGMTGAAASPRMN